MRNYAHAACLATLLLTGCKDGGVDPASAVSSPPEAILPQNLPDGWREAPASTVRSASYVLPGPGGTVADASLVITPGQPGGLLRHVNAWRVQFGQQPLDQGAFERTCRWTSTAVGEGVVVDITGLADGADPAFDGRLVAVVVERPAKTWFFKLRGNAALVAEHRTAFLDWVTKVEQAGEKTGPTAVPPEPAAPVSIIRPPAGREPAWRMPDGWSAAPRASTRYAGFLVRDSEGRTGEVSVALLEDDGGGALRNVNRWRLQAGLPATRQGDLAARIQSIFSAGRKISTTHLAGPACSTVAAWTHRDEGTWVFKLTGPSSVVDAERPRFAAFLKTIEFP